MSSIILDATEDLGHPKVESDSCFLTSKYGSGELRPRSKRRKRTNRLRAVLASCRPWHPAVRLRNQEPEMKSS